MQDKIINCIKLRETLIEKLQIEINNFKNKPTIVAILVGHHSASKIYVKNKKTACEKIGINFIQYDFEDDVTENELIHLLCRLNNDNSVHGILVQLPLPKHINTNIIIDNIAINKDIDGFNRYNIGSLVINSPNIIPCTPSGIINILDSINCNYNGANAVIVGASNIVGKPIAFELLNRNATITICHSKTKNLKNYTNLADILIIAIGSPKFITSEYVKENAIVIDVGINYVNNRICGDVDLDDVLSKISYITPVPNGVGKMTIVSLIANVITCYKKLNFN